MFIEIQPARKGVGVIDLLYPDHLLFEVAAARGQFVLKPFTLGDADEALVLPAELSGIVPGSNPR
jgi:hypothetical protein